MMQNQETEPSVSDLSLIVGAPSQNLQNRIDICWSWFGNGEQIVTRHEVFPDGSVKLVFRFSAQAPCRMVLIGPMTERSSIEIDQSSDYFGFRFVPGWAPLLAPVTLKDLINSSIDIERINGQPVSELGKRLATLPGHEQRQALMEDLIRQLPPLGMDAICRSVIGQMTHDRGRMRIAVMAQRAGSALRHLERSFRREIGLSPKKVSRLIRLRRVLNSLHRHRNLSMAKLAADCGFTDQSHMIRDFREMTGFLPGAPDLFEPRPLTGPLRTRFIHAYKP
jgi:AraC-like DNA-binding protein